MTQKLRADVCIVGAGPAGLTVAYELRDSGLEVLVLEAGPADPPAAGVPVRSTHNVGLPYDPAVTRSAGVGGSSVLWDIVTPAGPDRVRLRELDELDLEARGLSSVPGWPLGWSELAPHYRRARELFGLGALDTSREGPVVGRLVRRAYSFGPRAVFTTEIPAALAAHPRVRVMAGWTVTEVMTAEDGHRVTHLRCSSADHGAALVEAGAYVLAGGGIENARLLLASRRVRPAGLGNAHDLVGRYFMEHPHYLSGVFIPAGDQVPPPAEDGRRPWDIVVSGGHARQDKFAVDPALLRHHGLLNAAYKVQRHTGPAMPAFGHDGRVDQPVVDAYTALRAAVRRRSPVEVTPRQLARLAAYAPQLARHAYERISPVTGRSAWHTTLRVRAMGEQEPTRHSRLTLAPTLDRLGVPEARLDWRLSDLDIRSMVEGQRLIADDLGALLGGRVVTLLGRDGEPRPVGGAHHMGTTRMSSSPRDGVVDPQCRVHDVSNLYIAGSSVFPTGGAANPTLTLVALAARLAGHLARELTGTTTVPAPEPASSPGRPSVSP